MPKFIFATAKLILALGLLLFSQLSLGQGSVVGNGGDGIAIQFRNLARDISQNLKSTSILTEADLQRFTIAVEKCEITTENQLFLNGKEVDAINYPTQQKITISRARWLSTSKSLPAMIGLIFHEFLGLLDIHDDTLVKKYTDAYVDQFVNRTGDTRPQLVLQCKNSLSPDQVTKFIPNSRPIGNKNFLVYRQNADYQIYYQDNLFPSSTRAYDTFSHFLGYFKCHMNPDRTSVICVDQPCSQVTLKLDPDKKVSLLQIDVDRIADKCKPPGPANQSLPGTDTILDYLLGDIVFSADHCSAIY